MISESLWQNREFLSPPTRSSETWRKLRHGGKTFYVREHGSRRFHSFDPSRASKPAGLGEETSAWAAFTPSHCAVMHLSIAPRFHVSACFGCISENMDSDPRSEIKASKCCSG